MNTCWTHLLSIWNKQTIPYPYRIEFTYTKTRKYKVILYNFYQEIGRWSWNWRYGWVPSIDINGKDYHQQLLFATCNPEDDGQYNLWLKEIDAKLPEITLFEKAD